MQASAGYQYKALQEIILQALLSVESEQASKTETLHDWFQLRHSHLL